MYWKGADICVGHLFIWIMIREILRDTYGRCIDYIEEYVEICLGTVSADTCRILQMMGTRVLS